MIESPVISVVLPTYNGSRYVREAVESIFDQTLHAWELIVVDDASSDETPQIIKELEASDSRVRCVRHAENRKLPAALNTGFDLASGRFLTWTSDDNRYRPEAFEALREYLESNEGVDFVYADATAIDDEGWPIGPICAAEIEDLPLGNGIGSCFLYRRRVHEALGGYDERRFLAEDYDFWLRAAARFRLEPLHRDLYLARQHAASLTETRTAEVRRVADEALREHLPALTKISAAVRERAESRLRGSSAPGVAARDPRAEQHQRWSNWALASGNVATARRHAWVGLRRAPADIESWCVLMRAYGLRRSRVRHALGQTSAHC